ncbi:hypothetical protein [Streptomyces exfoliatus]|uniref:hypothetical protein n=1 Tax=Streptomyces exfoliatus TaxID=1905 RepID=UPI0012FF4E4A|nr:hypothetical protein [Streptomyces exfoliatus]
MGDALSTLVDTFRETLDQQFKRHPKLYSVEAEAAEDFARDAADWAISHCRWHLALGETISLEHLARDLGETPKDLEDQVARGELVALQGRFDTFIPVWQIEGMGDKPRIRENAVAVIHVFYEILGRFYRPENVISWAATKQEEIGQRRPRDVMEDESLKDDLIRAATAAARSLR